MQKCIFDKISENTLDMQIGISVKMHDYSIQTVHVHYHNFRAVCALRMQFV